jgi:hypothetical protein
VGRCEPSSVYSMVARGLGVSEVVLHVGDVSKPGCRGLLYRPDCNGEANQFNSETNSRRKKHPRGVVTYSVRQVQWGRLVLERDAPVQTRFHHRLSAEPRNILHRCSKCDPLRGMERTREEVSEVCLGLFRTGCVDVLIANGIRDKTTRHILNEM